MSSNGYVAVIIALADFSKLKSKLCSGFEAFFEDLSHPPESTSQ